MKQKYKQKHNLLHNNIKLHRKQLSIDKKRLDAQMPINKVHSGSSSSSSAIIVTCAGFFFSFTGS
jgi:hypothetical protein